MSAKVRIKISYNLRPSLVGFLTITLLATITLGYLVRTQSVAAASSLLGQRLSIRNAPYASSYAMRHYYLTAGTYSGASTDTACENGYHFASLWEILDPSNLKYNTDLGVTQDDSGQGPPSSVRGWVRTGYNKSTSSDPGKGNCDNWSSINNLDYGTGASLPYEWDAGGELENWMVFAGTCNIARSVWCVEDEIGEKVYLPLMLKN